MLASLIDMHCIRAWSAATIPEQIICGRSARSHPKITSCDRQCNYAQTPTSNTKCTNSVRKRNIFFIIFECQQAFEIHLLSIPVQQFGWPNGNTKPKIKNSFSCDSGMYAGWWRGFVYVLCCMLSTHSLTEAINNIFWLTNFDVRMNPMQSTFGMWSKQLTKPI